MQLKVFAPLCALLVAIAFVAIRSAHKLEKVGRAYGQGDFSPPYTPGEMYTISLRGSISQERISRLVDLAAKRQKDANSKDEIKDRYLSETSWETNVPSNTSSSR